MQVIPRERTRLAVPIKGGHGGAGPYGGCEVPKTTHRGKEQEGPRSTRGPSVNWVFLPNSLVLHELSDLPFLPVASHQGDGTVDGDPVGHQADAPDDQRPVEPDAVRAGRHVEDEE